MFLPAQPRPALGTAVAISDRGSKPDVPAILDELERAGKLEQIGGKGAVLGLAAVPPVCRRRIQLGGEGGRKHRQRLLAGAGYTPAPPWFSIPRASEPGVSGAWGEVA